MHARIPFICLALVVTVSARPAADSLAPVSRAQALLGPEIWSRVVRIENTAVESVYPRTMHALIFEIAGILWFYTPVNGTQSLSLHHGRVAEEKSDLTPLLREIEPGFKRWRLVAPNSNRMDESAAPLPNGCFVESVAALRDRIRRGEPAGNPQLLSYYVRTRTGLKGHTVLTYQSGSQIEIFDPARPERVTTVALAAVEDPLALARAVDRPMVEKARLLPIVLPPTQA